MSFLDGLLYKTGEFARLCNTTKETLRHYRDIGLLVPAKTGKNGYRLYSASQLTEYSFISLMRSLGCSLEEVATLMDTASDAELADSLARKRDEVRMLRRDLARKEHLLEHAIRNVSKQDADETPRLVRCPEDTLLCTHIAGLDAAQPDADATERIDSAFSAGALQTIFGHMDFCNRNIVGDCLPTTYLIGRDALEAGDYSTDVWICTHLYPEEDAPCGPECGTRDDGNRNDATQSPATPQTRTRSAGDYLVIDQKIDLSALVVQIDAGNEIPDPFETAYDLLKEYAQTLGRELDGDFFAEEISGLRPSLDQHLHLEARMKLK